MSEDSFICRHKAGGELRVNAVEFVPGQWDKPKQAAVTGSVKGSGSQHSVSGMTDDDSTLQGSDANANGWTAAEYSQQYYTAQVSHIVMYPCAMREELECLCAAPACPFGFF